MSPEYAGMWHKLSFKCARGHEWKTNAHNIIRGTWCPVCTDAAVAAARRAEYFAQCGPAAKARGGKCLTLESDFKGASQNQLWQCAKGHQWEAPLTRIKLGSWCPVCLGMPGGPNKKWTMDDWRAVAAKHGGKCLSKSYVNPQQKMSWECKKGHRWDTRACNIMHGSWCPNCANARKGR